MQRIIALLLGILLLAHALVPALPRYVCIGMGGAHYLHPCCPDSASRHQDEQPAWKRASCCQPEKAVAIDAQQRPVSDEQRVLSVVEKAAADALPVVVPFPRAVAFGLSARGDPTLVRPPPRLYYALHVLRI